MSNLSKTPPPPDSKPTNPPTFREELVLLLNKHNQEKTSSTPDFILAAYMIACLRAYEEATADCKRWRPFLDRIDTQH